MKKTYIIISAIAALALTSACNLKTDFPPMGGENVISLDLLCSEPGLKSEGVGKENAINSVDYFFYSDTTKAPVFSKRVENPTVSGNKYTLQVVAGEDGVPSITDLFKDGKFELYAVFNAPSAVAADSLTALKKTAVGLTFAHNEGSADSPAWTVTLDDDPQNRVKNFVMTGQKTVNKASGGNFANVEAEKTVDMKRLAAKVEVNLKIKAEKELTNGTTWTPMLGAQNVRLYLCNFVQNSLLSAADATPILPETYTQADYKVYALNTNNLTATSGYYEVASQQTFYTYPIEWEAGADNEPYLKLIVPWIEKDNTVPNRELYYKIMFPSSIKSIEANKFYKFDVTVDFLGNEGEPVITIKGYNAQVVDWKANSSVNSSVAAATFLSVEKDSIEYYTATSGISFVASDMVYLVINSVYQKNLNTGSNEYVVQNNNTTNQRTDLGTKALIKENGNNIGLSLTQNGETVNWIYLSNNDSYLEVGHPLNADLTSDHMDVTPWVYDLTMKLVGVDGTEYDRHVVFEQCPNVYVKEDANSAYAESSGHNNGRGYVYVNGNNSGNNSWNTAAGWSTGNNTNSNQYMYVITIAVSDKYKIGDPRTSSVDNLNYNNWAQARWTENASTTNHRLQYYHPGERTGTQDFIAPKIRIASSYGKAGTMSKAEARRRCAAYQEDGIPAGRWRLPTFAEVEFIATLSSLNRIPILFSDATTTNGDHYWIANGNSDTAGAALVDNVGNDKGVTLVSNRTSDSYVRCVYDEWFWGDAIEQRPLSTKTQFTWGDRNY